MSFILVTGGAGFIGSHLVDALLAQGHAVRVLDDLSTGSRDNLNPGAELIIGDVADPATTHAAMQGATACFHLAAIASVQRGNEDWPGTNRINLGGTISVLDAARRVGRIPVIYLWCRQARLRATRRHRLACAPGPLRRPAFLQRIRPAPGPFLSLQRRDFHFRQPYRRRPGRNPARRW
jgi:NAD(P)-dependent dehydrogenase (short-subunit alcohol dehydrogenase family)